MGEKVGQTNGWRLAVREDWVHGQIEKGRLQDAKWTMEIGGMVGLKKEGKQGSDGFLN